ncbi:MAG: PKD domain-containing protein [Chitinophagales bacterium]|nr:PKD domain-containing protein [Chitinophagales bacterium]
MKRTLRFGGLLCFLLYTTLVAKAQCNATFSYTATSNVSYHFTSNQSLQNGFTYYHNWRTDNVTFATTANADNNFYYPGTYRVCHTVSIQDSNATTICVDSTCIFLTIASQATCFNQVYVFNSVLANRTVLFTNTLADYTNVKVGWSFGDGTDTTGIASPTHYYSNFGIYNTCLYLNDTVRNCGDTICIITRVDSAVVDPCPLIVYFNHSQPFYNSTNIVFSEQVSGQYDSVYWDYGDGTTSSVFQSQHQFPAFGKYDVCATYANTTLGCTRSICDSVWVVPCVANLAAFNSTTAYQSGLQNFNATNLSYYQPLWQQWNFGDGTSDNSGTNTSHQYTSADTFTACYYVQVPGCAIDSQCNQVITNCTVSAEFAGSLTGPNIMQFSTYSLSDLNIAYAWLFGDGATASEKDPIHVFAQAGYYDVCLVVTDTIFGCTDSLCYILAVSDLVDTVCGFAFLDYNSNGIQEIGEPPLAGRQVLCGPSGIILTTDSDGYYEGAVPFDLNSYITITLLYASANYYSLPFGNNQYYFYFNQQGVRQCGFDFGVVNSGALITGKVFADYNQNGALDFEDGIPRQTIIAGTRLAVTGSDGIYKMEVPTGSYTIQRDTNGVYKGFSGAPLAHTGIFVAPGGYYQDYNFGINISSTYTDVMTDIIPTSRVSSTRKAQYNVLTTNLGPNSDYPINSLVTDAIMSIDSASTYYYSYDDPTHTTTWFGSLYPFGQFFSQAAYNVSTSAAINQNIYTTASSSLTLATDANPDNNTDSAHQIVVASFDPNNKVPDDCGTGPEGFIDAGKKIKFVINFENTGTDYAINIIVKDILDNNFDIKTFRYVGSSHPDYCDVKAVGDTIYFRFTAIELPFTEPESHGWVAFDVQVKPNLAPGTQLQNTAAIYFDHNEPIITNTTLHTISGPTAIVDLGSTDKLVAIPNPFTTSFTIGGNNYTQGEYTYTLSNLLGQVLLSGTASGSAPITIQRNELAAGNYIVSVYNANHTATHIKVVAQ